MEELDNDPWEDAYKIVIKIARQLRLQNLEITRMKKIVKKLFLQRENIQCENGESE